MKHEKENKMDMESKVAKDITKARADLVFDAPFFGAIALRLPMVPCTNLPTFGVDGYNIFYNVEFANKLTQKQITGVLAHEVLHVAMLHHTRRGHRNQALWNMACDYAINPLVENNGFELPADCLNNSCYHKMTAEQIYEDLLKDPDVQKAIRDGEATMQKIAEALKGQGGCSPQKPFDEIMEPPKDKTETAEQDAKELANTGIAAAKQAGNIPGGLEGIISACHEPQVAWRERLREILARKTRGDQVWHRPNKRLLDTMYLPYFEEVPTGNLVMAIDSSGSVKDEELNIFASEIQEIMTDNQIEKLTVLWVDTIVQRVQVFEAQDDIKLQVKGRGGTRFEPAFDWVQHESDEAPDALIYFTDGEATFPSQPPPYPVIWCITSKTIQAPWGETVELKF